MDKKSILVVDDSIIITNFVKRIFSGAYDVLAAHNGNEAIRIVEIKREDIAAVLLDLNMPECNGFQVLEYFRQRNLFDEIPVSLLTGEDSRESIVKAFQYPIVDMLMKPFNAEQAKNVLEKTIFSSKGTKKIG